MLCPISLLASEIIPASWFNSSVPDTANRSLSFGVSDDHE